MTDEDRYFIADVKQGSLDLSCGPCCFGYTVTSIEYRHNGRTRWIHNMDSGGCPEFKITDKDDHDLMLKREPTDADVEYVNGASVKEIDGLKLGDYEETIEEILDNPRPINQLIRYLILLSTCYGEEDLNRYIELAKGKYLDDIVIPNSEEEDHVIRYRTDPKLAELHQRMKEFEERSFKGMNDS